jgi:hypothetical protein
MARCVGDREWGDEKIVGHPVKKVLKISLVPLSCRIGFLEFESSRERKSSTHQGESALDLLRVQLHTPHPHTHAVTTNHSDTHTSFS